MASTQMRLWGRSRLTQLGHCIASVSPSWSALHLRQHVLSTRQAQMQRVVPADVPCYSR